MSTIVSSSPVDVLFVVGARPNFVKVGPLLPACHAKGLRCRLVHTGQHDDRRMSDTFFEELGIPRPDVNLGVGGRTPVEQIAAVMRGLEVDMTAHRPRLTMVVGDVNSTLAAALTASKLGIPVAHVEAGLRSRDRTMPEEINRILTDALSEWLFTTEPVAKDNLLREGIPEEHIALVGNVMIDTLFQQLERARSGRPWERFGLTPGNYALLTLHRPSNVDDPVRFASILRAVSRISEEMPVLFPVHPRTQKQLGDYGFEERRDLGGFKAVEPLAYLDSLALLDSSRLVLTDSGGLQEEACVLRVPCLTLRESTERPITIDAGGNRLVGWETASIVKAYEDTRNGPDRIGKPPSLWDGKASQRIAAHVHSVLTQLPHRIP